MKIKSRNGLGSKWFAVALLLGCTALALVALSIGAPSAAAAVGSDAAIAASFGGDAGAGGAPIGGAPAVTFFDNFEAVPATWHFSTTSVGNGYVANRVDCFSGTHCGDEYGKNTTGNQEWLSRSFALGVYPTYCAASVRVKALTAAVVRTTIVDVASQQEIASSTVTFPASTNWASMSVSPASPHSPFPSTAIAVHVALVGNAGTWQEILIDDLSGFCNF